MKITLMFPKDSKHPGRGFREVDVEISLQTLEMCASHPRTFIDCVVDAVIYKLAQDFCKAMGRPSDDCIIEYVYKQGEAMRRNVEAAVREFIVEVYEIVKNCMQSEDCAKCVKRALS